MTQWNRTIGRQVTNTLPQWRLDMVATDTVYEIGDAPSVLAAKIVWPDGVANPPFFTGPEITNPHFSYGSSVYVPDVGTYGTLLFFSTGEDTFHNQISGFGLSANTPTYDYWQQPSFVTSAEAAATANADWYYSPTDAGDIETNQPQRVITQDGLWDATWDDVFPVTINDWVLRRKPTNFTTGNNVAHWARYDSAVCIPASMTGTGYSAILCNPRCFHGPFTSGGGGWKPPGISAAQWSTELWAGVRRKSFVHAQNTNTKAWSIIADPIPDVTGYSGDIASTRACVDTVNKRVYYQDYDTGSVTRCVYYLDCSSGLASATFSAAILLTEYSSAGFSQASNSVLTDQSPAGQRLWFFKDGANDGGLLVIDLNAGTFRRIAGVTNLDFTTDQLAFSYIAASNEIVITSKSGGVPKNWRFVVPADPTNAANYSVTKTTLALDTGVTVEAAHQDTWQFGERSKYIPELGVICLTQRYGKILAYRPEV